MIRSLLNSGKRYASKNIDIYLDKATLTPDDCAAAFLISVGAGKAVERNRIKRWLREDFNALQKRNLIPGAFAVRFKGTADVNHPQLTGEMKRLFESIGHE
jgi:ribonuclease P protein component